MSQWRFGISVGTNGDAVRGGTLLTMRSTRRNFLAALAALPAALFGGRKLRTQISPPLPARLTVNVQGNAGLSIRMIRQYDTRNGRWATRVDVIWPDPVQYRKEYCCRIAS